MEQLRDYQETALTMLDAWWRDNDGNPCIVLPTGSGKSHLIAAFCQRSIQQWPKTRLLVICSQKELVEQDAEKILMHWPDAPMGICCAATGMKQLGRPVTVSSVLSIYRKTQADLGRFDLIIVDEAHLISHKDTGVYRTFIDNQKDINPDLRVIGLTATPYRLGHGYITDGDALFSAPLIQPVSILELQAKGYLSLLRSKSTKQKISAEGVAIRGGEYIESELQAVVDNQMTSEQVVDETIERAGNRRHWLVFCCGVSHAQHVAEILNSRGILATCVTGEDTKADREAKIARFKAGEVRALTNANVLTTGFDFPGIDLIVMMRPTMSPGLYVQMAGRGLRIALDKADCLVLDFAGNVAQHGPITAVVPPRKKGQRQGVAPSKICPKCDEIIPASAITCPECGYVFPREAMRFGLHDEDIMGLEPLEMKVDSWQWNVVRSRSGLNMIVCRFYPVNLGAQILPKFYCIYHPGKAASFALVELMNTAHRAGADIDGCDTEEKLCEVLTAAQHPEVVKYRRQGKYFNVISQEWRR